MYSCVSMGFESEIMKAPKQIILIVMIFVFLLLFVNFSESYPSWVSSWEKDLLYSIVFLVGIGGMILIVTR